MLLHDILILELQVTLYIIVIYIYNNYIYNASLLSECTYVYSMCVCGCVYIYTVYTLHTHIQYICKTYTPKVNVISMFDSFLLAPFLVSWRAASLAGDRTFCTSCAWWLSWEMSKSAVILEVLEYFSEMCHLHARVCMEQNTLPDWWNCTQVFWGTLQLINENINT